MAAPQDASHHLDLALAYVRGRLRLEGDAELLLRGAEAAGLDLHAFKRGGGLPRVERVLGTLRALRPGSLLDVGCGRGAFLFPLLQALPELCVLAVDRRPAVLSEVAALRRGGLERLAGAAMDVNRLALAHASFDVVTLLEVLEHLPDPAAAAREAVRVARRFVIASVPSQPDDNPEHLRLFTVTELSALLMAAGARRVVIEHVLNHRIAVARVA